MRKLSEGDKAFYDAVQSFIPVLRDRVDKLRIVEQSDIAPKAARRSAHSERMAFEKALRMFDSICAMRAWNVGSEFVESIDAFVLSMRKAVRDQTTDPDLAHMGDVMCDMFLDVRNDLTKEKEEGARCPSRPQAPGWGTP